MKSKQTNEPKNIHYRNIEEDPLSSYDPETYKVEQPTSQNYKPQPRSNTYLGNKEFRSQESE